jgi:hypothetical protein
MKVRRGIVFSALLAGLFVAASVSRATPPADTSPVILIQNATILTVSHGSIENGSILIENGRGRPFN